MIPLRNKPVILKQNKFLKPKEVIQFFKEGFNTKEEKYRIILLTMCLTGLRINEVCHIKLNDIEDLSANAWVLSVNIQKKKVNEIYQRVIGSALVGHLRKWIKDNYAFILTNNNYLFPHKSNNNYYNTQPKHVQQFLINKRKQLYKKGWGWVMDSYRTVVYNEIKNSRIPKNFEENRYKLTTHAFRRFFITNISDNPDEAKKIIKHVNIKTTYEYIDTYNLLRKEQELVQQLGSPAFFDAITPQNNNITAVWDQLEKY